MGHGQSKEFLDCITGNPICALLCHLQKEDSPREALIHVPMMLSRRTSNSVVDLTLQLSARSWGSGSSPYRVENLGVLRSSI